MPDLDLPVLQALCDSATPGPWEPRTDRYDAVVVTAGSNWPHGDDDALGTVYRVADANFIAASRTAIPSLIAELVECRRQRDTARDLFAKVEKELADKEAAVRALHREGDVHPWGPDCRECGWNYLPCATVRIFEVDYETLGKPVCSTCNASFDTPPCCTSPGLEGPGFHTVDGGCAANPEPVLSSGNQEDQK